MQLPVTKININDITGAEYNPRDISQEELTKLKNNIDEYGIVDPIIINLKNNRIVGGHQRYKALQLKGVTELLQINIGNIGWVFNTTELDIADENAEKILNLALNNISGEWNGKLSPLLQELKQKTKNYKLTGFDDLDIERLKIDTEVLFEENIIGKSWDKFKKAQGEEDWQDKYNNEETTQETTTEPENPNIEPELTEEEEIELLNDGIIREDDAIMVVEETSCPHCGKTITIDLFEKNFYDQVDGL